MVDSISGKPNGIQDPSLLMLGQQQSSEAVEKVNVDAAKQAGSDVALNLLDQATISDDAKKAYESEKEILRFSRLAQRVKEPFDGDKVARFKDMLDTGRINDYLRSISTNTLADSLLNSSSGAFLR